MKSLRSVFAGMLIIFWFTLDSYSQELAEPYSARAYWLEHNNPRYQQLLFKVNKEQNLSEAEKQWLKDYEQYLDQYFSKLSDQEKSYYRQFKTQWDEAYGKKTGGEESDMLAEKAPGVIPPKRFLLNNGIYGFGYGLAIDGIFMFEGTGAFALPFVTSGISMLMPVINKSRYENLTYSTIMLSSHGKFVGILHGAAISFAAFGDSPETAEILIPMMAMSIGLGEIGFNMSRKYQWSEGRVATYEYYGILGPFLASTALIASHAEHARPYGIAIPVSAIAGYVIADKVYKKYQFTRGDMLAASGFSLLSIGAGLGMVPLRHEEDLLAPMLAVAAGTIINHAILSRKHLTVRQGWNVNYLAGAGAIIGMGAAVLTKSQPQNVYFLLPASGGFIGWFSSLHAQTKIPRGSTGITCPRRTTCSFQFTPENYFLQKQLSGMNSLKYATGLPLVKFSLSL